jgi:hypothetical protein
MKIEVGDHVKVDLAKVKKYDNIEPYIRLVKKIIENSKKTGDSTYDAGRKGMPYVGEVKDGKIGIRAWQYDLQGDVFIPVSAVIKVVKG